MVVAGGGSVKRMILTNAFAMALAAIHAVLATDLILQGKM